MERHLVGIILTLGFIVIGTSLNAQSFGLILDEEEYETIDSIFTDDGNKSQDLPISHSLKHHSPFPQNQGSTNSCTTWSICYGALTIMQSKKAEIDNRQQITEQALSPYFVYSKLKTDTECKSLLKFTDVFKFLQEYGTRIVAQEELTDNDCNYETIANPATEDEELAGIADFKRLFKTKSSNKTFQTKVALAQDHPVIIGFKIEKSFQKLKVGKKLWKPAKDDKYMGAHAMTVVGYDDEAGAFEIMNSWGKKWANRGFVWVKYADFDEYCKQAFVVSLDENDSFFNDYTFLSEDYVDTYDESLYNGSSLDRKPKRKRAEAEDAGEKRTKKSRKPRTKKKRRRLTAATKRKIALESKKRRQMAAEAAGEAVSTDKDKVVEKSIPDASTSIASRSVADKVEKKKPEAIVESPKEEEKVSTKLTTTTPIVEKPVDRKVLERKEKVDAPVAETFKENQKTIEEIVPMVAHACEINITDVRRSKLNHYFSRLDDYTLTTDQFAVNDTFQYYVNRESEGLTTVMAIQADGTLIHLWQGEDSKGIPSDEALRISDSGKQYIIVLFSDISSADYINYSFQDFGKYTSKDIISKLETDQKISKPTYGTDSGPISFKFEQRKNSNYIIPLILEYNVKP